MTDLPLLLELQRHDSAIDRLKRRRDDLPEKLELAALDERTSKLEILITKQSQIVEEAAREQKRREDEMENVTQKNKKEEEKLYGGGIASPKELRSIQDEVDSLKKRLDELETGLIGAMEETEKLSRESDRLKQAKTQFKLEAESLEEKITAASREIDVELRKEEEAREPLAVAIPADILVLYDRLRREKNGVAVARLIDGICQGCRLELPAKDRDRIAKDALPRCTQCDRLLVIG